MRPNIRGLALAGLFILLLYPTMASAGHRDTLPTNPKDICPLLIGNAIPAVTLQDSEGRTIRLDQLTRGKPTILIFYRGGWCPYCNIQLADLGRIEPDLLRLGYQLVAISMDSPRFLRETRQKHAINYTLLSDSDANAAKAFGLAWRLEEPTFDQYRSLGFDIEQASGRKHHILPVPATFVVGTDGLISFAYVHPDFRIRVDGDVLLAAARAGLKP
ncbi:peroxiredoxin [Geothermobacter ehrlichii]|uniref:thioredoxin-dependent peroxiredoxin n=1 Tax=Geothermobacter ehrlichii TaxID=213224 RepID=A0A5D3WHC0_9BACT|nr:peroxiredoxin-like family protein [Geothermobacter ehrlichii]TYO97469.1 peroxiredoxin [Geothermobacter ehrlichii]